MFGSTEGRRGILMEGEIFYLNICLVQKMEGERR
jgi:hypothetical protein